ncbi:hypothetical protein [Flavobacterium sp. GCM10027622]|uniref:hypothetical protein n=1 Tax=unclassified Flavobacterium TaxID=196869 RepID=UPI0036102981
MKKTVKIILIIILIFIFGLFIRPQKVFYEAKVIGKVIDETGNPISDAIVYRIEEEYFKNKEIGAIESKEFRTQTVRTDKNGNFKLDEKSRIEWFHTPLDLPFAWCFADFEIIKNGYKPYRTEFDEFQEFHKENCYACEKIEFKPIITLKKKE